MSKNLKINMCTYVYQIWFLYVTHRNWTQTWKFWHHIFQFNMCERVKSCYNLKSFQKSFNILSWKKMAIYWIHIIYCYVNAIQSLYYYYYNMYIISNTFFFLPKKGNLVFDWNSFSQFSLPSSPTYLYNHGVLEYSH